MIHGQTLEAWCASHPLIRDLMALRETSWFNPAIAPAATALAGMPGMVRVLRDRDYLARIGVSPARLANATHLVWGTGGSMVPEGEFEAYVEQGCKL